MPFWGCYSYPYLSYLPTDFLGKVWAEDNPNSYFPRARAYSSSGGYLSKVNDRYLQKYPLPAPEKPDRRLHDPRDPHQEGRHRPDPHLFLGREPLLLVAAQKELKYVDPEAAINRSGVNNNAYYPWAKTFMFGIDITF